jgi:hypothetical protein
MMMHDTRIMHNFQFFPFSSIFTRKASWVLYMMSPRGSALSAEGTMGADPPRRGSHDGHVEHKMKEWVEMQFTGIASDKAGGFQYNEYTWQASPLPHQFFIKKTSQKKSRSFAPPYWHQGIESECATLEKGEYTPV